MSELQSRHCKACAAGTAPLNTAQIGMLLPEVPGWEIHDGKLTRTFHFKDYYETMAFVNAVAFVAHKEDHHPDLEVSYDRCAVRYNTHSVGGLSENDFICAAKVAKLEKV